MTDEHEGMTSLLTAARSLDRSRAEVGSLVLVGLSSLLSALEPGVVLFDSVLLTPGPGLAVAGGVLFGWLGAIAVAAGHAAGLASSGTVLATDAFDAIAFAILGLTASSLWRHPPSWAIGRRSLGVTGSWYAASALVAATAGASTMAWGWEITGRAPFFAATRLAASFLLAAILFGLPLLVVVALVHGAIPAPPGNVRRSHRRHSRWIVATISLSWFVVGVVISVGYRSFDTILGPYPYFFEQSGFVLLLEVYNDVPLGHGGRVSLIVGGGAMLALLLVSILPDDRRVDAYPWRDRR